MLFDCCSNQDLVPQRFWHCFDHNPFIAVLITVCVLALCLVGNGAAAAAAAVLLLVLLDMRFTVNIVVRSFQRTTVSEKFLKMNSIEALLLLYNCLL